MNGQDISMVVGFIVILSGLAVFTFKTKSGCASCQTECRKQIYDKIDGKDLRIQEMLITIIKDVATLTERVSHLK